MTRVAPKWRPSLGMITAGLIAGVIVLPLVGLLFFRLFENQLVRQAESELIGQAAVLREIYAREIAAEPQAFPVGAPQPRIDPAVAQDERYAPIAATLDLTRPILPVRPPAQAASAPPSPEALSVGARLAAMTDEAQRTTLAGFRLLDANGAVIAGREDVGASFAHVEEVRAALDGRFASALRTRYSDDPPPPVYSISRGTRIRVYVAMPVFVDGHVRGVVYLSRTPDNILRQLYRERDKVLAAALLALAAAAIIGAVFVRTVTRPMRDLARRAEAITQGDRAAIGVLPHYGTRELAGLAQSFMIMAKRLSDRSDYLSTFAAHVTHELKTPLTGIRGAAELMRDNEMSEADRKRFLDAVLANSARMNDLLDRLRELARADNPELGGATTLAEIVAALRARTELAVTLTGEADLAMSLENALIVFSNLADNAQHHGATSLAISARTDEGRVLIRVADNGAGVSAGNRAHIFDAFFTTRRESGGAGMGLGIVRAMLRAHGGDIALMDSDSGAAFEITLPARN